MYWSWTLPWEGAESLLGILIADNIEIIQDNEVLSGSLLSIGFIIGRVDFIHNLTKIEE